MAAPKFGELDNPFDFEDDDRTIHSMMGCPVGTGPTSCVRVVIVNDEDSDRTLIREAPSQPLPKLYEEDDELENVDETRVYTSTEWQLIKNLLAVL